MNRFTLITLFRRFNLCVLICVLINKIYNPKCLLVIWPLRFASLAVIKVVFEIIETTQVVLFASVKPKDILGRLAFRLQVEQDHRCLVHELRNERQEDVVVFERLLVLEHLLEEGDQVIAIPITVLVELEENLVLEFGLGRT